MYDMNTYMQNVNYDTYEPIHETEGWTYRNRLQLPMGRDLEEGQGENSGLANASFYTQNG